MAQNLNPSGSGRANYGATSSRVINVPDVSFSPTEFMSLSENIAQNIRAVNSTCIKLEKAMKSNKLLNYAQKANQNEVHEIHLATKEHIDSAGRDLQRLTGIVIRGDKQQKLQLDKLTKDFGNVVEKYSLVQKQMVAAMKQAISQNNGISQDAEQYAAEQENLIRIQRQEQADLQFEHSIMEDRENQIRQIEADILDVNAIMKKMAELVNAQAESVDRIEDRIEYSTTEVELARSELEKAHAHRRGYRRKVFIILIIAVIVGLIVTGIIVGNISK